MALEFEKMSRRRRGAACHESQTRVEVTNRQPYKPLLKLDT